MSFEDDRVKFELAEKKMLIFKMRELTGIGMMKCKEYLECNNWNITQAVDKYREHGSSHCSGSIRIGD
jgi:Translation elongation factor Ts